MSRIISEVYIEQTKHSTTVKNIENYIYNYACSKFYNIRMSVFWPRREYAVLISRMLWVQIPPTVDIKFLSCTRPPNLHSPFGKMSTDCWWQGVLHIELGHKILDYVLC